jgi:tight adherence protein B
MGLLNGVFAAGVLGLLGYRLPILAVKTMFSRRLVKFDRQLVDALDLMANAIKSGLSFMQVVQVIEREMPSPVSEEFGMVLKENRVGINLSDALLNMTKRVPSEDLFMIINSVVTLSQQGGDLSEAFDTIAKTIRERQRVLEKIRTLAQAGVTQGFILSAMPIAMLGMQWIIQPHYVRLLFVTPLGLAMLGGMVVMITFGALWMKKILTIEV